MIFPSMYLCLIGLNMYYLPKYQRSRKGKTAKLSSRSDDFIIFLMVQFLEGGKEERSERDEERARETEHQPLALWFALPQMPRYFILKFIVHIIYYISFHVFACCAV